MDQAAMFDLSLIEAYRHYREIARHHENAGRIDAAFACRQLDIKEALGQVTRIMAAALVTWIWVPVGNTGRSDVSAFRQMPVPEDLRELMPA